MSTLSEGIIFDIQRYCIHDGPGIRTTVFLKGCPLDCWWCHNPESKRPDREMVFWPGECIGCGRCTGVCAAVEDVISGRVLAPADLSGCDVCGDCADVCPTGALELVGREVTVEQVMEQVRRDIIFYDESGGGVTFSGGEPLMQPAFLLDLLAKCRSEGIHTAVDTSGHAAWKDLEPIAAGTDLFLYDLKVLDPEKHRELTGTGSELTLANLERLAGVHHGIRTRFPLVPGYTDDDDNLRDMARWLTRRGLRTVDVLPYHRTGMGKYERLGMEYRLGDLSPPPKERVERVRDVLRELGLSAEIGG